MKVIFSIKNYTDLDGSDILNSILKKIEEPIDLPFVPQLKSNIALESFKNVFSFNPEEFQYIVDRFTYFKVKEVDIYEDFVLLELQGYF
jgi:hypothetical protein